MGEFNGWVWERAEVVSRYRVPDENDSGEKTHGMCVSVAMSIANTHFRHEDVHKYICCYRENRVDRGVIDMFLVRKNAVGSLNDVQCMRLLKGGFSDHMMVVCRLALHFQ